MKHNHKNAVNRLFLFIIFFIYFWETSNMVTQETDPSVGNSTIENFDAIIIGAGQAGPSLAEKLCHAGMRVAIIERNQVGGTCVNTGCTPTKAMIANAYVAYKVTQSAMYGIKIEGSPVIDMTKMGERVKNIVMASRNRLEEWLQNLSGCVFIRGHARFENNHVVSVNGRILKSEKIFINVGGRPSVPPIPGLDEISYLTSSDMIDLKTIPRHLVIIGGSYVGLEFAQMFRRFGADVTVIERGDRLIPREDAEISSQIQTILENEGVILKLNSVCTHAHQTDGGVVIDIECKSVKQVIEGSHVLVAVGRRPNTDDLGLHNTGITIDASGNVLVNDELKTNVEGIWALGDCNGLGAFTHTAYNDFEIVSDNILHNAQRSVADRIPAYALFIDPPLGRVGMTESEAKRKGKRIRVGMRPMTRVSRAVEKGETQGSMHIIVDAESDQILGAAILGPGGDEAIHTVLVAMHAKVPFIQLARTMGIHPTVSELIPTILNELTAPY